MGIPIPYCAGVEDECGREFTRRDFRPNDWRAIWPELSEEAPDDDTRAAHPIALTGVA